VFEEWDENPGPERKKSEGKKKTNGEQRGKKRGGVHDTEEHQFRDQKKGKKRGRRDTKLEGGARLGGDNSENVPPHGESPMALEGVRVAGRR